MTDKSRADELDSVPITAIGRRRELKRKAQAIIRDLEAQLAAKDRRIEELEQAVQQSKSIMSTWRDQSSNDRHLTGVLDVSEVLSANWRLALVELPRVATERDSERARADKAEAEVESLTAELQTTHNYLEGVKEQLDKSEAGLAAAERELERCR